MARRSKNMQAYPVQTLTPDELSAKKKECLEAGILLSKEMEEAKKAAKSVAGKIAANKKAFKKLGGEKSDYDWYLEARHRDPAEIDAETRRRNEIAKLMRLPIGSQLGLFSEGISVATVIDGAPASAPETDPFIEGRDAAFAGKSELDCPYKRGHASRTKWLAGHKEGFADYTTQTFQKDNPGVAHQAAH